MHYSAVSGRIERVAVYISNPTQESTMTEATNADRQVGLARRRTGLATFRTAQALDRSTFAWVRTTLTMGNFGFGMIGFFRALHVQAATPESDGIGDTSPPTDS
jgi:hypothetical protein